MDKLNFIAVILVALFTAIAFGVDLKTGKLPNWLTMPALIVGIIFHTVIGGWGGLQHSLLGGLVGFALLLVLFLIGAGGGGDVKFMAALGAWFGPSLIVIVFIVSAVLALIITIAMIVAKMMFSARTDSSDATAGDNSAKEKLNLARQTIPYGVPVCLASWIFLLLRVVILLKTPVAGV